MSQLILFNKPFRVMSQFSPSDDKLTLAQFITIPGVYPAGRLDYDSEGLLLLTDDGALQHRIAHPDHKLPKTYWAQVEGEPNDEAVVRLQQGVALSDGPTQPARVKVIGEPNLWPRNPPIRIRQNIPTHWLEIAISEGRNRQVRRMTAAVGLPTLRLVRVSIGPWRLETLQPGEWRCELIDTPPPEPAQAPSRTKPARAAGRSHTRQPHEKPSKSGQPRRPSRRV